MQALLADSAVELEAARLLVHKRRGDQGRRAERITYEAAIAKLFATEAAQRIIDRCLQLHGGNGVVKGAWSSASTATSARCASTRAPPRCSAW